MTPYPIHRRTGLLLAALLTPLSSLRAEEANQAQTSPREILRDALYAEEVTRDAGKAAEHYSKVLELYRAQQPFAATALFRLAEVRRKQGNKEEAAKLYQQLLREFPNAEVEGKLARENLAAMGGAAAMPEGQEAAGDDAESKELRRIQELARSSPDLARDPDLLFTAATKGQSRVMAFLIDSGISPQSGPYLGEAAGSGNLKAVEFLISKGCDPAKPPHEEALTIAAQRGFRSIAELLLKSGANPNHRTTVKVANTEIETSLSALHYAAGRNDEAMCRLLLDHGADPNFMPEFCWTYSSAERHNSAEFPLGTPLHQAFGSDHGSNTTLPELLLKAGAKPELAAPNTGMTPLHFAIQSKNQAAIRLLLEAGVPVNAQTRKSVDPSENLAGERPMNGVTPLDYALESRSEETVRLLLDKGADPSIADERGATALAYALTYYRDMVPLLLEKGAKPDSPDLLISALNDGVEIVRKLLDAGADPSQVSQRYNNQSPLQWAITSNQSSIEVIELLLERGAKVDEAWLKKSTGNTKPEVRRLISERFILPELLTRPAITLTYTERPGETWTLAKREGEAASPAQLESLLTAEVTLPRFTNYSGYSVLPQSATIQRREAGGGIKKIPVRLDGSAPLPRLEWGDVVELVEAEPGSTSRLRYIEGPGSQNSRGLMPEALWNLRRHVSIPIIIHPASGGDGKPVSITLRGDCLVYHPGEPIAPPLPASDLAKLLWSRATPDILLIRRAGWPEVRIGSGSIEAETFKFQPGDEITPIYEDELTERKLLEDELAKREREARDGMVSLTVPGTSFAKTWDASHRPSVPTLVEVLADLYAAWPAKELGRVPETPDGRLGAIAARQQGIVFSHLNAFETSYLPVPVILEHPDFSKIRIHRHSTEGGESVLEVDLTKAIAATTLATTREEASRHDVALQPGDLIELPRLPQSQPKQEGRWRGFSEAEGRFFGKVLSGLYQCKDNTGTLRRQALVWQPVRWVDAPDGPLPLPPEPGVASTAAKFQAILGRDTNPSFQRGESGQDYQVGDDFFIRDGDRLTVSVNIALQEVPQAQPLPQPQAPVQQPQSQPQLQQQQRPPRPRR